MSQLHRRRRVALVPAIALAAAALLVPAAGASAQPTWRCEAGALSGAVLTAPLEPVTAGALDRPCVTESKTLGAPLPPLLTVESAIATTTAAADGVSAAGGVLNLHVLGLPSLLPPIQIPKIPDVEIPPLLPGLPSIKVPIDLSAAIAAALPDRTLPTDLVSLGTAVARASARCVDGRARVETGSEILGLRVLGLEVLDAGAVERTLTFDSASIELSKLDLSLIPLADPLLRPLVNALLKPILAALPPIQIPAALVKVKVTPGDEEVAGGVVTRRALRIQVGVAGQDVADLTVGSASVAASDTDCRGGDPGKPPRDDDGGRKPGDDGKSGGSKPDAPQLALQCTSRKVVLIDVLPRGRKVRILGAADRSYAGRRVSIVFDATGKTVARPKVGKDGAFSATAKLPPKRLRATNRARYRAVIGRERSLNLKLMRRMVVDRVTSRAGKVTVAGRVLPPLAREPRRITVRRRVTCSKSQVVGRVTPRRDGRFSVTVKAPKGQRAAVYRLQTQVRQNPRSSKLFPTYSLPRAVDLH